MSLFISPCLVTYKSSHCPFTSRLQRQEVLEELFAGIGEDGFGVELDAFDFVATMAETHDDAVVSLGRDGELARQGFFLDDEGMVARRGERVGQLAENVFMVVMNLAGFAVKEFRGADDFAAERKHRGWEIFRRGARPARRKCPPPAECTGREKSRCVPAFGG